MKKLMLSLFIVISSFVFSQERDGRLDPLFGTNGQVTTCDAVTNLEGHRVIIQNDNKIVVGGLEDEDDGFILVRCNTDGTLDRSFGTNGIVQGPVNANLASLALQPDNKIVAGGVFNTNNFILARYNSNGTFDTTFGAAGVVIDVAAGAVNDIAIQTNGKIVAVGGDIDPEIAFNGRIIRFNSNGTRDVSFGVNGEVIVAPPLTTVNLRAVQLQADNKIVVVGSIDDGLTIELFLARYLGDGSIDRSFGDNGFTKYRVLADTFGKDVAIQADGSIVALMSNDIGSVIVARFTNDGLIDVSFGVGGMRIVDQLNTQVERMQLQSDGKIVIIGTSASDEFKLNRITVNGDIDTSFGNNGVVTNTILDRGSIAFDLAINSQGHIIGTGAAVEGAPNCIALAQYQVNSLDCSQTSQALWTRYYNQNIKQQFAI